MNLKKLNIVKYLIASEASFMNEQDSFVGTLIFCIKHKSLSTKRLTENGDVLIYNPEMNSICWKNNFGKKEVLFLDYIKQNQIVNWIETNAIEAGITAPFNFSDCLPNFFMDNKSLFPVVDIHREKIISIRDIFVQIEIDNVLNKVVYAEAI